MKKIFAVALVAVSLSACGEGNEGNDVGSSASGDIVYKERCIDGVVYLVRKSGYGGYMSVKFGTDSKVVTCQ